jgi:hypothetical protein
VFPTAAAAVAIWMLYRLLVEIHRAEQRNRVVRELLSDEARQVRAFLDELGAQDRPRPPSSPSSPGPPPWRPTIIRPYAR